MSGHPMRGVEGAGAYRTGHPLGGDNGTAPYRFQKKMKRARQAAAPCTNTIPAEIELPKPLFLTAVGGAANRRQQRS